MKPTPIMLFYGSDGKDHAGRTYEDILKFTNDKFDKCHDFVQWLFPLHEASRMTTAKVPIITEKEHEYFKKSELCKSMIRKSMLRFSKFLIETGPDFWCKDGDHNLMRITRVIRSLRLFDPEGEAWLFHKWTSSVAEEKNIDFKTLKYWDRALYDPLFETLY